MFFCIVVKSKQFGGLQMSLPIMLHGMIFCWDCWLVKRHGHALRACASVVNLFSSESRSMAALRAFDPSCVIYNADCLVQDWMVANMVDTSAISLGYGGCGLGRCAGGRWLRWRNSFLVRMGQHVGCHLLMLLSNSTLMPQFLKTNMLSRLWVVIRDNRGHLVKGLAGFERASFSPRTVEAFVVREALLWLKSWHLDHVIIMSDCMSVVHALTRPIVDQ